MEPRVKTFTHPFGIWSHTVKLEDGMLRIHSLIVRVDVRVVKISWLSYYQTSEFRTQNSELRIHSRLVRIFNLQSESLPAILAVCRGRGLFPELSQPPSPLLSTTWRVANKRRSKSSASSVPHLISRRTCYYPVKCDFVSKYPQAAIKSQGRSTTHTLFWVVWVCVAVTNWWSLFRLSSTVTGCEYGIWQYLAFIISSMTNIRVFLTRFANYLRHVSCTYDKQRKCHSSLTELFIPLHA